MQEDARNWKCNSSTYQFKQERPAASVVKMSTSGDMHFNLSANVKTRNQLSELYQKWFAGLCTGQ